MLPQRENQYAKGQSLIGILVSLAIFSILSQAIFTVVSTSLNLVSFNRSRITARHLAQEKIELIRNLPYNDVGTLSIVVFDADGDPVPQAGVSIVAPETGVNLNVQTGNNGRVILPGAPTCIACYQITVSKSGFSSERTYSTSEVPNPIKPHQTILEGQLTEISFAIDTLSTLAISTYKGRENNFETLANASFNFRGQKTIGMDAGGQPIYKYEEVLTTDASGNLTEALEWDNYQATPSASIYNISGTNPLQPLTIVPGTSSSFKLALSAFSTNNLLISFVNSSSNPIASVSATLTGPAGFDETKLSGATTDPDFGQVFFSNLLNQDYTLLATASGYLDYNATISVLGETLEQVNLTAQ